MEAGSSGPHSLGGAWALVVHQAGVMEPHAIPQLWDSGSLQVPEHVGVLEWGAQTGPEAPSTPRPAPSSSAAPYVPGFSEPLQRATKPSRGSWEPPPAGGIEDADAAGV